MGNYITAFGENRCPTCTRNFTLSSVTVTPVIPLSEVQQNDGKQYMYCQCSSGHRWTSINPTSLK